MSSGISALFGEGRRQCLTCKDVLDTNCFSNNTPHKCKGCVEKDSKEKRALTIEERKLNQAKEIIRDRKSLKREDYEALASGLIDKLGGMESVINRLAESVEDSAERPTQRMVYDKILIDMVETAEKLNRSKETDFSKLSEKQLFDLAMPVAMEAIRRSKPFQRAVIDMVRSDQDMMDRVLRDLSGAGAIIIDTKKVKELQSSGR